MTKTIFLLWNCFLCLVNELCFAQQPKLISPVGHTAIVGSAKFSSNGTKEKLNELATVIAVRAADMVK